MSQQRSSKDKETRGSQNVVDAEWMRLQRVSINKVTRDSQNEVDAEQMQK